MKSLVFGSAMVLALTTLGSDASAGLTDEAFLSRSASAGATRGVTLAKAKKKKRRPPASGGKASAPADDDAGDDDAPSKSSSSSASSDDAKEDEVLGSSSKKKRAADDGDSSDDGGGSSATASRSRPKMAEETVETKASPEESEGGSVGSALEFGLGGKALFRSLAWTADARAAGLGPYSLTPGPETGAWLELYPAAFATKGFAANIGVFGRFDYGFGVATTLANNDVVKTTFRDFLLGAKLRIPMGAFVPNVSFAYGLQLFAIAPQNTPQDIPQLAYSFVRPALGGRAFFTPGIWADFSAGYLVVLNPGSGPNYVRGSDFFPRTTAFGFDVGASIAFKVASSVGLRVGVDYRRYVLNLNPDSTTRSVAGAVDQYIVAWGGVEVVLDGQGGGAASGDDDDAKPKRKRRRAAEAAEESSDDESKSSEEKPAEDE